MSEFVERRARELLAGAVDGVTPSQDLDHRIHRIPTRATRASHRRLALGALVVGGMCAGIIAWFVADGGRQQVVTPVGPPSSVAGGPAFSSDHWTELGSPPVRVSAQAAVGIPGGAVLWEATNSEDPSEVKRLRLWHLDLTTNRWTSAPDGTPASGPVPSWAAGDAAWSGDEVVALLVDTTSADRATASFETVRWTPGTTALDVGAGVSLPPEVAGWDPFSIRLVPGGGRIAALVSVGGPGGEVRNLAWSYDPERESWTRLPDLPTASDRVFALSWTGDELVVVSGRPTSLSTFYDGLELFRLRPGEGRWSFAATPPGGLDLSGQSAGAAWDGTRLVVVTYTPSAAAWDPSTDTWTPLEAPPIGAAEDYPAAMTTAGGSVVTGYPGRYAGIDPGASTWRALPDASVRAVVATGDLLIGEGQTLGAGTVTAAQPPRQQLLALRP